MSLNDLKRERHRLRQELLAQRLAVEQALANVYSPLPEARSHTMRFIRKNSSIAVLIGRSLRFLIASRFR
jgi:uncharacterized protein YbcC (UPF0753/DUF2309 family)